MHLARSRSGKKEHKGVEKAVTSAPIAFSEAETEEIKRRGDSYPIEFYLHVDVREGRLRPEEIVDVLELRLSDDVKADGISWKEAAGIVRYALNQPEFVDSVHIGTVVYTPYTPPPQETRFYTRLNGKVYQADGRQIAGCIDELLGVVEALEGVTPERATGADLSSRRRTEVVVQNLSYFVTEKPNGIPGICEMQTLDVGGHTYDNKTERGLDVEEWLKVVRDSYAAHSRGERSIK